MAQIWEVQLEDLAQISLKISQQDPSVQGLDQSLEMQDLAQGLNLSKKMVSRSQVESLSSLKMRRGKENLQSSSA